MDNCNNNYADYFIDILKNLRRTLMAFEVDVKNIQWKNKNVFKYETFFLLIMWKKKSAYNIFSTLMKVLIIDCFGFRVTLSL